MAPVRNPYANPKPTAPPPKAAPKPRYGKAQAAFVASIRLAIDGDPQFFHKNDWSRIAYSKRRGTALTSKKKLRVDDFYVRDIAAWVPHLIIPGYIPSCARCGKKEHIEISKTEWIENPKLLYGTHSHRYLDTKYYYCNKCCSSFTAWHTNTLQYDANEVAGILNYRLSKGFAVDEELYSFIVNHGTMTTAAIHQRLRHMLADNWLNDCAFYYRAVMANRVKDKYAHVVFGTNQQCLDHMLVALPQLTAVEKRVESIRFELKAVERDLREKEDQFNGDVLFASIFQRKHNRNSLNQSFPGIGISKCLILVKAGIYSAKELLDYDGNNPAILHSWKRIVERDYEKLSQQVAHLRTRKSKLETDLTIEELIAADNPNDSTTTTTPATPDEADSNSPPFSSLLDTSCYNGRCVSKATVDQIFATDFKRRKALQLAKMRNIKAEVLKIDWAYKIAPKVKVYLGRGKAFSPFKSSLSIQNEDSLTVFWKFYCDSESVDLMANDLKKLAQRQRILNTVTKLIYVDNCCTVRLKLLRIFPHALVKCDTFHWFVRWDECLFDLKSEYTVIFRRLMRRAVFLSENEELERARDHLTRKHKREPTQKEIFRAAKAIIPPPLELERRVMAVIHALMEKDAQAEREATTTDPAGDNASRSRFFKRGTITVNTIIRQLKHVRNDCLSDPPKSVVAIHRLNPKTGEVRTARSTGGNETDNRYLNRLLDTPSIGLPRADRTIHNYYEESNDRKMVNRLGTSPGEAKRLEQLQALHGMALACGFKEEEIPFAKPSYPRNLDNLEEHIGFDYCLPCRLTEDVPVDEVIDDDAGNEELRDFLQDNEFDESDDLPIDATQFQDIGEAMDDINDLPDPDPLALEAGNVDLSLYLPAIVEGEKTYDTYVRLTNGQPWIPFKDPSEEATFTDLDKRELELWKEMSPQYDRHSKTLQGPRGYKTFADAWDAKVANIYRARLDGEKVALINRKSYTQLQEQHDTMKRHKELLDLANDSNNDPAMQRMEDEFRTTRRQLAPHQTVGTGQAPEYCHQNGQPIFGVPFALNTSIAVNAFQQNPNALLMVQAPPILYRKPVLAVKSFTRQALGPSFKAKLFCWKCGFQRKEHCPPEYPFGDKCTGNLGYEHCSKCIERIELHNECGVGPWCTRPAGTRSKYNQWWKEGEDNTAAI